MSKWRVVSILVTCSRTGLVETPLLGFGWNTLTPKFQLRSKQPRFGPTNPEPLLSFGSGRCVAMTSAVYLSIVSTCFYLINSLLYLFDFYLYHSIMGLYDSRQMSFVHL